MMLIINGVILKPTQICDMIKRTESDVRNIDFELQAKIGDKCMFHIVLKFKELVISLQSGSKYSI